MKYNCPFKLYDIIIYVDNPKESTEKKKTNLLELINDHVRSQYTKSDKS